MYVNKSSLLGVLLVPLVGFVSYLNTIKAGFAYDDNRAIIENIDISTSSPWSSIWKNDFWGTPLSHSGSHKSYRPLTVLTFRLNHIAGGLNPMGYHLVNVLLHSGNSFLVFILASNLLGCFTQSLIAGLLFAVHPVHTEAVAGVVGRADVLACLFFLIAFMSYEKATVNAKNFQQHVTQWRYVFASIVCAFAAMLTKETGITVLPVCIIYEFILVAEPQLNQLKNSVAKAKARGCFSRIFCLVLAAFLSLFWRLQIMDLATPDFHHSDNPTANHPNMTVRLLTFLYLPVLNVYLMLFPWQLSFDWSMDAVPLITSFADRRNIGTVVFYMLLGTCVCKFVKCLYGQSSSCVHYVSSGTDSDSSTDCKRPKSRRYLLENDNSIDGKTCSGPFAAVMNFKFNCAFRNGVNASINSSSNGTVSQNRAGNYKRYPDQNVCHRSNGTSVRNDANACNSNTSRNNLSSQVPTNMPSHFTLANKRQRHSGLHDMSVRHANGNSNDSSMEFAGQPFSGDGLFATDRNFNQSYNLAILSLAITVISFLPATNVLFYVGFVVAERILYIPSVGYCLLFAIGFGYIWNNYRKLRHFLKYSLILLLVIFAIRTVIRNEDWQNEEALYRSGLHINPAKAWGNLGIILSNQGRLKDAEEAYRNAIQARPNMADTHYNLGILLQNSRRYKESIESYKSAIEFRPSLASAHLNLGLVFDKIGRKQDAMKVLQAAKDLSDHGLKNPKAHQHALTSVRYNVGRILFDLGRYKESVSEFRIAIDKMPTSFAPHSLYNMLGQSYSFLGDNENAEHWYLKSLKANRTHIPAHLTYARHLASVGKLELAEHWFQKALQLSPENSDSHFHYAEFLLNNNRQENALAEIEKAVKLNPNEVNLVAFAASSFREAQSYEKAEFYYKKAIKLKPKNPAHHMNLGALFHLTGSLDDAEASYLEAIKLNPGDALTMTNLNKLRSMKARANSKLRASN